MQSIGGYAHVGLPLASLRVQQGGIEFQQLWQQARAGCEQLLNWHQAKHLEGKAMTKHIVDHYTIIYRLASNPGRNVPGLVKGGANEPVAGKDDQSTQVLVLYYLLREMLKSHLDTRVKPRFAGKTGLDILHTYQEQWKEFVVGLDLLSVVFRYLHNHWTKQGIPAGHITTSTKPLGLTLWSDYIVNHLKGPLESELLDCIRADREGSATGTAVDARSVSFVRSVVSTFGLIANNDPRRIMFLSDVFDNPYNRDTERYYNARAADVLQKGSVMEYISTALRWTREEMARVERYCTEKSAAPSSIRKTLLTCLVESRVNVLFQPVGGLLLSLSPEAMHDLGLLYQLIQPSETTVQQLSILLRQRIVDDGLNSISSFASRDNQGAEFVQTVLELHRKYRKLIDERFNSNPVLLLALRNGCESFINNNPHHRSDMCAEFLARHANTLLRPSQTRDDDLERGLKEVVDIFDFFSDRDVFQTTYSALLCQRLIQQNMREEWEDRAICAFREKCGRDVTYHWERMLADATTTKRDNRERYVQCVTAAQQSGDPSISGELLIHFNAASKIEFQPLVLTSAWWPLKPDLLPFSSNSVVGYLQRQFEAFYKSFRGGRSISWMQNLSNGVLEARVNPATPAPLTCTVSALQWELLNLFGELGNDVVTFQSFKVATGSSDIAALQRAAFAFLKLKLLTLVNPAERDVEKQTYALNTSFTSPQRRINFLAQGALAESAISRPGGVVVGDENIASVTVAHQVHTERRFAVQAAIVRVMKSRRSATYADLFAEVEGMLRKNVFAVTPQDLKANLELLIEKEYVERSPNDPNTFVYLT